jgi:hypothetical protein
MTTEHVINELLTVTLKKSVMNMDFNLETKKYIPKVKGKKGSNETIFCLEFASK